MYKVTYAIDYMDPCPTVAFFDEEWEAQDWIDTEVSERVQHIIDHSPYTISQEELDGICESEYTLVTMEKVGK
jgi:hypothetical protein